MFEEQGDEFVDALDRSDNFPGDDSEGRISWATFFVRAKKVQNYHYGEGRRNYLPAKPQNI